MSGFAQHNRPLVNLRKFMSSRIPTVARRPAVVRRPATSPVNTKATLDAAQKAHYAAEAAKELKDKHDAVTKTQKKVVAAAAEVNATKLVKAQKKAAKDIVPDHQDKTQVIGEHNDAVGDHEDAKDNHHQAKNEHKKAKAAVKQAGGRRRRHTRPKRRKSKHRRRKRRTKKRRRKRHTKKRRKRHTKKHHRSRRR